jgi:hypothetical protein
MMLPGAILCSYLAYLVGGFINNLSLTLHFGSLPNGWLKVVTNAMAHSYMGAVFIYSAVRIAPSAPRYVAIGTSVLLVVFAGLSIWSSFVIAKFYALPAICGLLFGGFAALYATLMGEVFPYGARKPKKENSP